jgi:hypothetical protein
MLPIAIIGELSFPANPAEVWRKDLVLATGAAMALQARQREAREEQARAVSRELASTVRVHARPADGEGGDRASIVNDDGATESISRCGPLPVAEAIDFLLQAREAVHEGHMLRIVHRDLKPASLFVTTTSDGRLFIKSLDFGISKTSLTEDASVTASTAVLGTTFPEVIAAIALGRHTRLSDHRSDLPAGLEQAVEETLAHDREARIESVEAFAKRLVPFGTDGARASYACIQRLAARVAAPAASGDETEPRLRPPKAPPARPRSMPGTSTALRTVNASDSVAGQANAPRNAVQWREHGRVRSVGGAPAHGERSGDRPSNGDGVPRACL